MGNWGQHIQQFGMQGAHAAAMLLFLNIREAGSHAVFLHGSAEHKPIFQDVLKKNIFQDVRSIIIKHRKLPPRKRQERERKPQVFFRAGVRKETAPVCHGGSLR